MIYLIMQLLDINHYNNKYNTTNVKIYFTKKNEIKDHRILIYLYGNIR